MQVGDLFQVSIALLLLLLQLLRGRPLLALTSGMLVAASVKPVLL
jgi:hypothetical protein